MSDRPSQKDKEAYQYIKGSFTSFSQGPKIGRLVGAVIAMLLCTLFVFLFDLAGSHLLPSPWNYILLVAFSAITVIWHVLVGRFWNPLTYEELMQIRGIRFEYRSGSTAWFLPPPDIPQPPNVTTLLSRLPQAEAWGSLWFGGLLLQFSFLGLLTTLCMWHVSVQWGTLNFISLIGYGLLYPLLLWNRRWLLRIGIGFEHRLMPFLRILSWVIIGLVILTALLTRTRPLGDKSWVLIWGGIMVYVITCLGVAAAIRLFGVAHIRFQTYQELKSDAITYLESTTSTTGR